MSIAEYLKEGWIESFDEQFSFDGVTYKGQRHWKENVKQNLVKSFITHHNHTLLTLLGEELEKQGRHSVSQNDVRRIISNLIK